MAGDTPPSAEDRYTSAIVSIAVGRLETKFYIHQKVLEADSPFFKAALNKRWIEGKSLEVCLPEDESEVFAAYVDWLYQRTICTDFKDMTIEHLKQWTLLSKLYVLAEKLQDDECCDATMERMIEKSEARDPHGTCYYPSGSMITRLYNGTLPGAPVRKFLVEAYRLKGKGQWITDAGECNHSDFLVDLVTLLLEDREIDFSADCFSSRKKLFLKKG